MSEVVATRLFNGRRLAPILVAFFVFGLLGSFYLFSRKRIARDTVGGSSDAFASNFPLTHDPRTSILLNGSSDILTQVNANDLVVGAFHLWKLLPFSFGMDTHNTLDRVLIYEPPLYSERLCIENKTPESAFGGLATLKNRNRPTGDILAVSVFNLEDWRRSILMSTSMSASTGSIIFYDFRSGKEISRLYPQIDHEQFAFKIGSIGDVDDDGVDELLVISRRINDGVEVPRIFSARKRASIFEIDLPVDQRERTNVSFASLSSRESFSGAIETVNYVALGTPYARSSKSQHVGAVTFISISSKIRQVVRYGEESGDEFGSTICDIEQNGSKGFLVSAPGAGQGRGHLYICIPPNFSPQRVNFENLDVRFTNIGRSLRSIGDLTKDGVPEVAVGALEERKSVSTGSAPTAENCVCITDLKTSTVLAAFPWDDCVSIGDVDGDGLIDLANSKFSARSLLREVQILLGREVVTDSISRK